MVKIMKKIIMFLAMFGCSAMAAYQPVGPNPAFVTTNLLASGGNYTSEWISAQGYSQVQTHILASHNGTLTFQFAEDSAGVDVVRTLSLPYVAANGYQLYAAPVFGDYLKYSFTNTSGQTQTDMYYETKLMTTAINPQLLRLDAPVSGGMIATVGRSILMGKTEGGGYYDNVSVHDGNIEVGVMEPRSAFGEISIIEPTPVAQIDAVYNTINNLLISTNAASAGTVSAANQMFAISTGADSNSSASAYTKRYAKYRPGQGVLARWTALYTANASDSYTFSGMLDADQNANGFGFGYTNTTFGIWHWNGGTYTHIPQTSWNVDTMLGGGGETNKSGILLDPTKLNVFQVRLTYLGAGNIDYFIMSPTNGQFSKVHSLKYPNNNTAPSLAQPSLNVGWRAVNGAGSATEKIVRGASAAMFIEGKQELLGPVFSASSYIEAQSSADTNVNHISLRVCTNFNGKVNRSAARLKSVSFAGTQGAGGAPVGPVILRLLLNANPTGLTYTAFSGTATADGGGVTNGTGVTSYSSSSSTRITGGTEIFTSLVPVNGGETIDLLPYSLIINPGDTLSAVVDLRDVNVDVGVAISIVEDQ